MEFDHLLFSVLDIDDRNVLHVLFKFSANQRIVLHRHCALNKTFVIQGEHRLYHANGELKDVRPAGSYTVSPPADEPHREGGGDQDVVVLFTIYDREGPLYEILDDNSNIVATLSTNDFVNFTIANTRALIDHMDHVMRLGIAQNRNVGAGLIEKVCQLFRNLLQARSARYESHAGTRSIAMSAAMLGRGRITAKRSPSTRSSGISGRVL